MSKLLVIYHGNCADGFGAAWAVRNAIPDAEFYAGTYQAEPPDVAGRDVVFVDFSYKPNVLHELSRKARSMFVLDHHKSAADSLPHSYSSDHTGLSVYRMDRPECTKALTFEHIRANQAQDHYELGGYVMVYAYFDMNRSGAGLAWDVFNPGKPRPALINHIEDRDLWRFALPGTREIQANVFSYPYDFATWDRLMSADPESLRAEGEAIERKHFKDIAELVNVCRRRMWIGGVDVPVASLPYTLASDAGHLMAENEPFAACYWDTVDGRVFSLRSRQGGTDVSKIAQMYGGGGHANASGFKVPRDNELAVQ